MNECYVRRLFGFQILGSDPTVPPCRPVGHTGRPFFSAYSCITADQDSGLHTAQLLAILGGPFSVLFHALQQTISPSFCWLRARRRHHISKLLIAVQDVPLPDPQGRTSSVSP